MEFTKLSTAAVLLSAFGIVAGATAQTSDEDQLRAAAPPSLRSPTVTVPQPTTAELGVYVADFNVAKQLGKALFWDMQIGSDGVTACATCHFQAGADSRSINQLNPGADGKWYVGPNLPLQASHFPLRRLSETTDRGSTPAVDVNDVVASQGVFNSDFKNVNPGNGTEQVKRPLDPVFSVNGINVRRVEPRHAPSVINAVFNYRNFWDGRAQNEFNGVDNWGDRNPNARVYKATTNNAPPEPVKVRLVNSSLASQAVAPILSTIEMSAAGRSAADIGSKLNQVRGKKVSLMRPLGMQVVHPNDSVLGSLSRPGQPGLNVDSYETLIRQAFRREWWDSNYTLRVNDDGTVTVLNKKNDSNKDNEYRLIEYNFSLFFGLALQIYQATLVADDTPYDRWLRGEPNALAPPLDKDKVLAGLRAFLSQDKVLANGTKLTGQGARCINCHAGPALTDASTMTISTATVRRAREGQDIDRGFNNIGVRSTLEDRGVGGTDPFGNPLSATALCRQDPSKPNCPVSGTAFIAVDGAFKVPGLRNVELTAPYFHNGGYYNLEDVINFYNRGGDYGCDKARTALLAAQEAANPGKFFRCSDVVVPAGTPPAQPLFAADGVTEIRPLGIPAVNAPASEQGLTADEKAGLLAFLKALTDERVLYRKAPFDHPQLFIPNGQLDDNITIVEDKSNKGQAMDRVREVPAVGAEGGAPLPRFLEYR
jgi:cytochrome c peroxidase